MLLVIGADEEETTERKEKNVFVIFFKKSQTHSLWALHSPSFPVLKTLIFHLLLPISKPSLSPPPLSQHTSARDPV